MQREGKRGGAAFMRLVCSDTSSALLPQLFLQWQHRYYTIWAQIRKRIEGGLKLRGEVAIWMHQSNNRGTVPSLLMASWPPEKSHFWLEDLSILHKRGSNLGRKFENVVPDCDSRNVHWKLTHQSRTCFESFYSEHRSHVMYTCKQSSNM